jgi:ribosomal 30S subunit maturation factor RimM
MPIRQTKTEFERANNHIKDLKARFKNVESIEINLTSSNQEFFRTSSQNEQVFSNVFYPNQEMHYSPVVKINDYSKVGEISTLETYPNIKIIIKIYEGGNSLMIPSLTVFGLVVLSIMFLTQKRKIEQEFWKT